MGPFHRFLDVVQFGFLHVVFNRLSGQGDIGHHHFFRPVLEICDLSGIKAVGGVQDERLSAITR